MGFEIKESATILGMEISNNTANFNSSALKIGEKIKREANWWARFNLSLPGRINVTKSMLDSQLNYLGSFLPFTQEQILLFSDPIENYVRGNLNISKNRIYTEIKNGGLGLCNIKDFLDSQKRLLRFSKRTIMKSGGESYTLNAPGTSTVQLVMISKTL